MPTECFWVEPTGKAEIVLRRFTFGNYPEGHESHSDLPSHAVCPAQPVVSTTAYQQGHDATSGVVEVRDIVLTDERFIASIPATEFEGHEAWPKACEHCGADFADEHEWQVNQRPVYRAADGREWNDRELPPGALFHMGWRKVGEFGVVDRGDGIILGVVVPAYRGKGGITAAWCVDGPASTGGYWTRTGDPRNPPSLSVTPSIAWGGPSPDGYHGFLTQGVLSDDLDAASRKAV